MCSHKHYCFTPNGNNTFLSLIFLSLKLDIGGGGMNPQSSITLPLGVAIYYLAKATNAMRNMQEHSRTKI